MCNVGRMKKSVSQRLSFQRLSSRNANDGFNQAIDPARAVDGTGTLETVSRSSELTRLAMQPCSAPSVSFLIYT